jgi:hypothetical protein
MPCDRADPLAQLRRVDVDDLVRRTNRLDRPAATTDADGLGANAPCIGVLFAAGLPLLLMAALTVM